MGKRRRVVLLTVTYCGRNSMFKLTSEAATDFFYVFECRSGGNVVGAFESTPTGDFKATITDASGREVCTFNINCNERYVLSFCEGVIAHRKLAKDEHYWSRATLQEMIREMTSKN